MPGASAEVKGVTAQDPAYRPTPATATKSRSAPRSASILAVYLGDPNVIYVVTSSGTDWAAIVGGVATFATALAAVGAAWLGIRGTSREAARGRAAAAADAQATQQATDQRITLAIESGESTRRLAFKRNAYAELQAALNGSFTGCARCVPVGAGNPGMRPLRRG
jgi:hypothetical protein